jgi:hypothetical protein
LFLIKFSLNCSFWWIFRCVLKYHTAYHTAGWFSEESDKIGRGFIKILATWQFGLSFNTIRHIFFCFGLKNFFCRLYEFLKNFGLAQKKNRKITLLAVNNAFFIRFSWLNTFFEGHLVIFWFLLHFENFCKFWIFFTDFFFSDVWPSKAYVPKSSLIWLIWLIFHIV